uniref:Chromosome 18 open reading frame 21 n=1 Tax=Nothobranchius korthausae TaxID=1143690 RepID=A0A1A8EQ62_9TELE
MGPVFKEHFLFDASLLYQDTCPELSRFFLKSHLKKNAGQKGKIFSSLLTSTSVCSYCYQWLKPDNHHVRLRPKRRPSARVQSILLRRARGQRLSLMQKKLLLRFLKSSSTLMATCHACSKTSRHQGVNREFLSNFSKTPRSANKHKTPQSSSRNTSTTPRTSGKDKTPSQTPRSSISSNVSGSSSTSSKSSSKPKNWVVRRLSKLLMREEKDSSKKGGLKDFLSSL